MRLLGCSFNAEIIAGEIVAHTEILPNLLILYFLVFTLYRLIVTGAHLITIFHLLKSR